MTGCKREEMAGFVKLLLVVGTGVCILMVEGLRIAPDDEVLPLIF